MLRAITMITRLRAFYTLSICPLFAFSRIPFRLAHIKMCGHVFIFIMHRMVNRIPGQTPTLRERTLPPSLEASARLLPQRGKHYFGPGFIKHDYTHVQATRRQYFNEEAEPADARDRLRCYSCGYSKK